MWQKKNNDDEEYHLLFHIDADLNGHEVPTACGETITVDVANQKIIFLVPGCAVCVSVWHLVCASVAEGVSSLPHIDNLIVLRRSYELTKSVTLARAILARIRKLEKSVEKERKLRLIQQAYD
jgi:hypothetical protein